MLHMEQYLTCILVQTALLEMEQSPGVKISVRDSTDACYAAIRSHQYEEALTIAKSALHDAKGHHISMFASLQTRSTVYCCLNRLDDALRDCRRLVHIAPQDPRGYMQCANIEINRNNRQAALVHLERGIRNTPVSARFAEYLALQLGTVVTQIRAEIVLTKPRDPMSVLPNEVIQMIFNHLDYRQHVRLLRVSSLWNNILRSLPTLTTVLDFPGAHCVINPIMLEAAFRRWTFPKKIRLEYLTAESTTCALKKLEHGEFFQSLEIIEARDELFKARTLPIAKYSLKAISICKTEVPFDWISQTLLPECSNLEVARFEHVTKVEPDSALNSKSLRTLEIALASQYGTGRGDPPQYHPQLEPLSSNNFFSGLPRLESITCGSIDFTEGCPSLDFRHMKRLKKVKFWNMHIPNMYLSHSVRSLNLTSCYFPQDRLEEQFPSLVNLEDLTWLGFPYPQFLNEAIGKTRSGKLKTCLIEEGDPGMVPSFLHFMNRRTLFFQGVKTLHLINVRNLDHTWSRGLSRMCPDLTELRVDQLPSVTDEFFMNLIKAPDSKTTELVVDCCDHVSEGVVPWAHAYGVKVTYEPWKSSDNGRVLTPEEAEELLAEG